jgi:hypothetical protein
LQLTRRFCKTFHSQEIQDDIPVVAEISRGKKVPKRDRRQFIISARLAKPLNLQDARLARQVLFLHA